jgi:IS30 family transposase
MAVVQRITEQKESLRTIAAAFGVSHETIRRIIRRGQQES